MNAASPDVGRTPRLLPRFLLVAAIALAAELAVMVLVVAPGERAAARTRIHHDFELIAEARSTAISLWFRGMLTAVRTVATFPSSVRIVQAHPSEPPDPHFGTILSEFADQHTMRSLAVLDSAGRVRAESLRPLPVSPEILAFVGTAERANRDTVGFFLDATLRPTVVAVADLPVGLGGVVAVVDPGHWLLPLLHPAPKSVPRSEALLIEVGDAVTFLTPGYGHERAPMRTRAALASIGGEPLVYARSGFVRGEDESGERVLALVTPIPSTPWRLVLKTDESEALAVVERALFAQTVSGALFVLALVGLAFSLLWGQRRATEASVAHNRARFAAVMDDASDAIVLLDEGGTVRESNQRADELFGDGRSLLGSSAIGRLVLEDAPDRPERSLWEVVRDTPAGLRVAVHRTAGGRKVPIEVSARRSHVEDEGGWIVVVRDVSGRRESEAQIRRLNRLLRATSDIRTAIVHEEDEQRLFDSACRVAVDTGGFRLAVMVLADERRGTRRVAVAHETGYGRWKDTLLASANDAVRAHTPSAEAIRTGRTILSSHLAVDPRFSRIAHLFEDAGLHACIATPLVVSSQVRGAFALYSGEAEGMDDEALSLIHGLVSDLGLALRAIEERTRRRQLEDRLRAVFASGPAGIVALDASAHVTDANDEFLRIAARTRAEVDSHRMAWGELCEVGARIPPSVGAPRAVEGLVRRPDGTSVPVLVGRVAVDGTSGESVALLLDVTQERLTAESLRQTQLQLLQAQKLETVGRLAGGVAHDFNNLLTVIHGYTELMLAGPPRDAEDGMRLEQIQRAAERASGLTRQLLAFSRRQVLEPRVIDLAELVRDAEKMLRRLIGEDVELAIDCAVSDVFVLADPGQVEQVLMNLIVNARDALPQGGHVRVGLSRRRLEPGAADEKSLAPGEYVALVVEDDGDGISAEVMPKIFEPFFTTKELGKGTGLGLATVEGIVRQSGGAIEAASEPGRGARFTILLPLVASAGPGERAPRDLQPGRGESVLLVEDDATVRALAHGMLARMGYDVCAADGAATALEVAADRSRRIDLLLTDVVMRGGNGRDLARRFLELRPGVPVLFVSGFAHDASALQTMVDAGHAFLPKPFSAAGLQRAVRDALQRAARVG